MFTKKRKERGRGARKKHKNRKSENSFCQRKGEKKKAEVSERYRRKKKETKTRTLFLLLAHTVFRLISHVNVDNTRQTHAFSRKFSTEKYVRKRRLEKAADGVYQTRVRKAVNFFHFFFLYCVVDVSLCGDHRVVLRTL